MNYLPEQQLFLQLDLQDFLEQLDLEEQQEDLSFFISPCPPPQQDFLAWACPLCPFPLCIEQAERKRENNRTIASLLNVFIFIFPFR